MTDILEDIDIEIADKPLEGAEIDLADGNPVEAAPETAKPKEISPEEGLEELKNRLVASEQRERDSRRQAQEHANAAQAAQKTVQETQLDLVNNAISGLKQTGDMLETSYAQAMADSDWVAAAKIQRESQANEAKLLQLEQGKVALESQPEPQARQVAQNDPVEVLAQQLSGPSANWVRGHPEYAAGWRFNNMVAADGQAREEGIAADTPAYFERVEQILGIRQAHTQVEEPARRSSSPPAAPVSRGSNGNGSKPNVVRLTAQEREIAEMNGMTDAQYAAEKLKIQRKKEGNLH